MNRIEVMTSNKEIPCDMSTRKQTFWSLTFWSTRLKTNWKNSRTEPEISESAHGAGPPKSSNIQINNDLTEYRQQQTMLYNFIYFVRTSPLQRTRAALSQRDVLWPKAKPFSQRTPISGTCHGLFLINLLQCFFYILKKSEKKLQKVIFLSVFRL